MLMLLVSKKNTGYIKGLVMSSEYQTVLTFSSGALKAYETSGAQINCWDIAWSLHFHRDLSTLNGKVDGGGCSEDNICL